MKLYTRWLPLLAAAAVIASFTDCSGLPSGQPRTGTTVAALSTVSVTQGADELRTSWYPDEGGLAPSIVSGSTFGQLFSTPVDGQVFAQPLVSQGTLFVVTETNNAYGLDAQTGGVKWSENFGTPLAASDLGCADISPSLGITSTPVIDQSTNVAYFFAESYVSGASGAVHWTAHALNVATGAEQPSFPLIISGAATNDSTQAFTPRTQGQRPGLLLMNGVVYAAFGSHCDISPWAGWVVGVSTAGRITTMWAGEAGSSKVDGAGIWQGGGGLVSDNSGQILFATGNGGAPEGPVAGSTAQGTFGDSVVRLAVQSDGSLKATDFFTPYDGAMLDSDDLDLGSGGVVGLPSQYFGTSKFPDLATIVGKQGYLYLLNRDSLGGASMASGGGDNVVARIGPNGGIWGKPAVWPGDGGYLYTVSASSGTAAPASSGLFQTFQYGLDGNGNPTFSLVASSSDSWGFGSGSPVVTSSGTDSGSALVWTVWTANVAATGAQLRAYDPVPVNGAPQLVYSAAIGQASKFASPGIAGNRVYVGAADGHVLGFGAPLSTSLSGSGIPLGNVIVGSSASGTITVSASATTAISGVSISSGPFSLGQITPTLPTTLQAGGTLTIPVTFAPTASGMAAASVTVSTSGTPLVLSVTGTGTSASAQLAASPASVSFGGTDVGQEIDDSVILENLGGAPLTINSIGAPAAPFGVVGAPAAGTVLDPGSQITVTVTFNPSSVGTYMDSLSVNSSGGALSVGLTGSCAPPGKLVISPMSIDYGTVGVGASLAETFQVSNTGGSALTITKSKPPILGPFTATTTLSEGSTLYAGSSAVESVTFTPTVTGATSDQWTINGGDGSGVQEVAFTGTGAPALTSSGTPIALVTQPTGGGNKNIGVISDGVFPPQASNDSSTQYDTYNGTTRTEDWIGYQFTSNQTFGELVFQPGIQFGNGGWFTNFNVQVLQSGNWVDVPNMTITPAYKPHDGVNFETYEISFPAIVGTGIRLDGTPGGSGTFISVGELDVYQGVSSGPETIVDSAGPPQSPNPGATVTLYGTGSSTSNGDGLTYHWTQTSGPTVALSSNSVIDPTFVAPPATVPTTLTFSLVVSDGELTGSASTVTVNDLPTPGPDITASGTAIALVTSPAGGGNHSLSVISDGVFPPVGSTDSSMEYDTYTGKTRTEDWIGYQYSSTQLFGSMEFQLGIQFANGGWFSSFQVQVLQSGTWVDVPGLVVSPQYQVHDGVNYESYDLAFPAISGQGIRLDGVPGGAATFISVGELRVFQGTASAVTLVSNAGTNETALAGSAAALDGSGSSASNGDALRYAWTQTAGPTVTLSSSTAVKPTFQAPAVTSRTTLTFSLVVSDGSLVSSASTVTVTDVPVPAGTDITPSGTAIALVTKPTGQGNHNISVISDGVLPGVGTSNKAQEYDTFTGTTRTEDWIGYQFASTQSFRSVLFQPGIQFGDGGWFTTFNVQVLQSGTWVNVPNTTVTPAYGGNDQVNYETYVVSFPSISGTGIRIDGTPGGTETFISVAELRIYQAASFDVTSFGTPIALITKPTGQGNRSLSVIGDGVFPPIGSANKTQEYDTYTGTTRTEDWIGYQFAATQSFGSLVYQPGIQFSDGGWFTSVQVQVLQSGAWVNVPNLTMTPTYRGNDGTNFETYTFSFPSISGTGIRLDGAPGGKNTFISIGELRVYAPAPFDITTSGTAIALITAPLGQGNRSLSVISDGVFPPPGSTDKTMEYDTYTGTTRTEDWIGYQFPTTQSFASVVFDQGIQFSDGGWFTTLQLQVLQSGAWVTVPNVMTVPAYKGNDNNNYEKYVFSFPPISGTGLRVDGAPGGKNTFISVGELRVQAP
jgi:hypothetical protein